MAFNPEITELTTAATDAVIAVLATGCLGFLARFRAAAPWRVGLWCWVFGLLALAATLGAIAHGFDLSASVRDWLWRPLFLALGLVVALFVVGAVHDLRGQSAARRALVPMVVVGAGFFAVTEIVSGSFLVFVIYEAAAMLAALGMYAVLTARRRLPGAAVITAGIVLNIIAAAIQATGTASVTIVVPFDYNGVFHFVQMAALVVMTIGLARGMPERAG